MDTNEKYRINDLFGTGHYQLVSEQERQNLLTLSELVTAKLFVPLVADYKQSDEWLVDRQSRLIEAFLVGIPVPGLVLFRSGYTSPTLIIDGEQRLKAICGFFKNEYSLWDLSLWPELDGLYFADLPFRMQDHLKQKKLGSLTILKDEDGKGFPNDSICRTMYRHLNSFRL
jgi:hypothetical protein